MSHMGASHGGADLKGGAQGRVRVSYAGDGNRTIYILCSFAIVAMLFHAVQLLRQVRPRSGLFLYRIPGVPALIALCRSISYLHWRGTRYFRLPAMRSCIIIGVFFVATVAWILSLKPYYQKAGAPSLALRAGMVSVAMYPFIFACALKVNPISFFTGISHARLQIYHQSLAFMMFFFGLVHMIAFLHKVSLARGYAGIKAAFHKTTYWTGAVAICLVAWMLCSSLGVFRRLSYRFFVVQHIVCVMMLLGFLFVHVADMYNARYFLWAAVAFWGFSVVVRTCMILYSSSFLTSNRATVDIQTVVNLPLESQKVPARGSETVRLSFTTPLRWRPGQHIYVRFPSLNFTQAHPFTIMSLPSRVQNKSQLVLLAKVHEQTTRKLFNHVRDHPDAQRSFINEINTKPEPSLAAPSTIDVEKNSVAPTTSVSDSVSTQVESAPAIQKSEIQSARVVAFLDGPYGFTTDPASYEHVLLFAGGSGVSYVLPIAMHLMRRCAEQDPRVLTKRIRFVWTAHTTGLIDWLESDLAAILRYKKTLPISIELDVHVTGEASGSKHESYVQTMIKAYGVRPNIDALVKEEVKEALSDNTTSLATYVCGPGSLAHDLSNAMAKTNLDLARGRLGSLRDVYLDVEHFDW
ncbi:hypothetical protein MYAM1_003106 [Malassezia yamatoensis]|uniref:ferric-chelate reductase (NADPH) n=1 Tax=Malassezia yamatoensis TaxID=253288 RepID=A0AAJ5YZG3_9BASI|nr:hypothetical protein MYAM1_003106 [Malassezia yamatoensis]